MAKALPKERRLELAQIVDDLIADGMVETERGKMLKAVVSGDDRKKHPLIVIAHHKWPNAKSPQHVLDLPVLTQWLADRVGLPLYRIDPLKIDVPAVTGVMSYAYARRFNILAVEVRKDEVVIATAEPYEREWERELAQILGKRIERVMGDPEQIERYLLEFYSLSNSVRAAATDNPARTPDRSSCSRARATAARPPRRWRRRAKSSS